MQYEFPLKNGVYPDNGLLVLITEGIGDAFDFVKSEGGVAIIYTAYFEKIILNNFFSNWK